MRVAHAAWAGVRERDREPLVLGAEVGAGPSHLHLLQTRVAGAMARAIRDSTHFCLDILYDTNFSFFHRKTNGVGVGALGRSCIRPILSLLLPHTAKTAKTAHPISPPLCHLSLVFDIITTRPHESND